MIIVEIPGFPNQVIESQNIPPVGTQFEVHKHLTDGGTYLTLEVTGHKWRLDEPARVDECAYFRVEIQTRVVD